MTYNYHAFTHVAAPRRHGNPMAGEWAPIPMEAGAMDRLMAWFSRDIALPRAEAHSLLAQAVESGQMAHYHAEFVAAIKALATGPQCWDDMGYRLLPDD